MENKNKDKNSSPKNISVAEKTSGNKFPLFLGNTARGMVLLSLSQKVLDFVEGIGFSVFITLVTIITLFSDDIRQIFFSPQSDEAFSILTLICMSIYTFEMVVLSLLKEGYFLRYYFWLDLVSTLTMILDLVWINDLMNGGDFQNATNVVKIARASRASKIGAKSTKLIRILRLIRVLRLYKTASKQLNK